MQVFPVYEMSILTYNWVSKVIIKNALIFNIILNVFNREVIYIILVLLKIASGFNYNFNIRYYARQS